MKELDVDVRRYNMSGGIIIRGPPVEVNRLIALVKLEAASTDVKVIFSTTSSRRLWVKQEGVEP